MNELNLIYGLKKDYLFFFDERRENLFPAMGGGSRVGEMRSPRARGPPRKERKREGVKREEGTILGELESDDDNLNNF